MDTSDLDLLESLRVVGSLPRLFDVRLGASGQVGVELVKPQDDHDLKQELGAPVHAPGVRISADNPLGWQGYRYDVFGTYHDIVEPGHYPVFGVLGGLSIAAPRVSFIFWQRRVFYGESGVHLEVRWHPERGDTVRLHGSFALEDAAHALQALTRGFTLLKEIERRGRPRGSTAMLLERLPKVYPRIYHALWKDRGERPRQLDVAEILGVSERTFGRYLKQCHLPWPPA